jgi:hypothetical protein
MRIIKQRKNIFWFYTNFDVFVDNLFLTHPCFVACFSETTLRSCTRFRMQYWINGSEKNTESPVPSLANFKRKILYRNVKLLVLNLSDPMWDHVRHYDFPVPSAFLDL